MATKAKRQSFEAIVSRTSDRSTVSFIDSDGKAIPFGPLKAAQFTLESVGFVPGFDRLGNLIGKRVRVTILD